MITSRAVFALHYSITAVSSRRHAVTRDYAETLGEGDWSAAAEELPRIRKARKSPTDVLGRRVSDFD